MKLTRPASAVLLSGLGIRLGLAPFTGHPGDIALFVTPQRLFYQAGSIDLKYFPTLPTVYYFAAPSDGTSSILVCVVSGLLKLFGFVSFALAVCDSIIRRRFCDELPLEIFGGLAIVAVALFPVFLFGGVQSFLQVLVYRFI